MFSKTSPDFFFLNQTLGKLVSYMNRRRPVNSSQELLNVFENKIHCFKTPSQPCMLCQYEAWYECNLCQYQTLQKTRKRKLKQGLLFFFHNCIVPLGFLLRKTRVAFPWGKPAATESRNPTYGACWVF